MKLTQLTSADLKRIATLLEQKEALEGQIAQVNSQLAAIEASEVAPAPAVKGRPGRKPGPRPAASVTKAAAAPAGRARRGAVKAAIMDLIQSAGKPGITVKDIAARMGAKYNRVFTWFYTTGRNIQQIKKVGPGKYAWSDGSISPGKATPPPTPAAAKPASPASPAKAPIPAKRAAGKRAKPGQFKDAVLATVKAAGKAGINVKEIAKKLGLNSQRIYVWFNATGKNVKAIKKVAPATYAWAG